MHESIVINRISATSAVEKGSKLKTIDSRLQASSSTKSTFNHHPRNLVSCIRNQ
jgi:hypothetical protein